MRPGFRALVVAAVVLCVVVPAQVAHAAVLISRAELSGTQLRLEGSGARGGAAIAVNGTTLGNADSSGQFRIQASPFAAPASCVITVSDGATSAQARLSGCTPTSSTPPPSPPPPSPT